MEEDLALGLSAGPGSGLVEEDLALGLSAGPGEPVLTLWKLHLAAGPWTATQPLLRPLAAAHHGGPHAAARTGGSAGSTSCPSSSSSASLYTQNPMAEEREEGRAEGSGNGSNHLCPG